MVTKKTKIGEQTFSMWVRSLLLHNPMLTLEELQAAYDKSGRPKAERPKDMTTIYGQRSELCKRWGIANVKDIPLLQNGRPNIAQLAMLYFNKHPQSTEAEMKKFFADHGLDVQGRFYNLRNRWKAERGSGSPDPNQTAGPRAGNPGIQRRQGGRKSMPQMINVDSIKTAIRLINETGSIDSARAILTLIEQVKIPLDTPAVT